MFRRGIKKSLEVASSLKYELQNDAEKAAISWKEGRTREIKLPISQIKPQKPLRRGIKKSLEVASRLKYELQNDAEKAAISWKEGRTREIKLPFSHIKPQNTIVILD